MDVPNFPLLNVLKLILTFFILQAQLVSKELIRVAILWHEMWHEALEEASRLYFGEHNIEGMLAVLDPLHVMLEEGPETLKETAFIQVSSIFLQVPCFPMFHLILANLHIGMICSMSFK